MKTSTVFGLSPTVSTEFYEDRGALDARVRQVLARDNHVVISGDAKSGKTWLRKTAMADALIVQCRFDTTLKDVVQDALHQLGLRQSPLFNATGDTRPPLADDARAKVRAVDSRRGSTKPVVEIGDSESDLLRKFRSAMATSMQRLVIEDFHLLSLTEQHKLASEMKAMWDMGLRIVLIGRRTDSQRLFELNTDLAGRVEEISLYWETEELRRVLRKGAQMLNLSLATTIEQRLLEDANNNVGLMQQLLVAYLDEELVAERAKSPRVLTDIIAYKRSAIRIALQLDPVYKAFAARVMNRILTADHPRSFALLLRTIVNMPDAQLKRGVRIDTLINAARAEDVRAKQIDFLGLFRSLDACQDDGNHSGVLFHYDAIRDRVVLTDRQFLFYRAYSGVFWPWDRLLKDLGDTLTVLARGQ